MRKVKFSFSRDRVSADMRGSNRPYFPMPSWRGSLQAPQIPLSHVSLHQRTGLNSCRNQVFFAFLFYWANSTDCFGNFSSGESIAFSLLAASFTSMVFILYSLVTYLNESVSEKHISHYSSVARNSQGDISRRAGSATINCWW